LVFTSTIYVTYAASSPFPGVLEGKALEIVALPPVKAWYYSEISAVISLLELHRWTPASGDF